MRGHDEQSTHMFSYLSPEQRVPADHPLRAVRALTDEALRTMSRRFAGLYANTGRPSIPPEQLLRALLLQVLYTVRSERLLMEELNYNLLFRWFVGLNLDDPGWHPTTFTKDRLSSIVKPDRAAILLVDPDTGAIVPRAVRPAGAYSSVSEFASSTVVRQAMEARDAFIVHDVRMDSRLQDAASVLLAGVRSVICVPLLGRSGAIGALYADKLGLEQFAPDLAEYASAFAGHAAAALETAQLYDDRERHFRATLQAFAKAIDARDRYTAGHSERVTAYTLVLARQSGQHATEFETIRRAGLLHDIGKVGVPECGVAEAG